VQELCTLLGNAWVPVLAADGEYATQGQQWIWFLVKPALAPQASLLPITAYDAFAGKKWDVNYWGEATTVRHSHYRHPQVMVLDWSGTRFEFIGLHLKSKFVNQGASLWNGTAAQRHEFVQEALKARIKLATEAANVRAYVDAKFAQTPAPGLFVMGDLNDGPGKELLETRYLFFDLVSNLQGDVFFARHFLNHALFDYQHDLRWSVHFEDFVEPARDPHILLDHILVTQALVDGSLPLRVQPGAGFVEHERHALINAPEPAARKTSDHVPVSVRITTA
jgi:endonuclease/exonuclease/phosphatase family metal-dependent hydrolase